ncbi:putative competence/damage-inducible protein CinA [Gonapodya prolifera JEL478]|uniref:Putative competence/damage-inducible protein CinA n=1 Tax=Gonapodya prolifera (strain JEL478) TaxID=1344416 RepID=A0A139ACT4_GONPJ|nr:putative competence/damage-inducible protein CinA [Gonapodya prolifera JEL478]|eukprot:KXS14622.1 putative competence/damage-inducible protein CinA [Gonapodya prolifera JEL478]
MPATWLPSDFEPLLQKIAQKLIARKETVAVAESTTGGLLSASLLSVAGASAYYRGGAVLYTLPSRKSWAEWTDEMAKNYKGTTPELMQHTAESVRKQLDATWCIGESGIAGPKGFGPTRPAGLTVVSIVGPVSKTATIKTGLEDRPQNMEEFARRALGLFVEALEEADGRKAPGGPKRMKLKL